MKNSIIKNKLILLILFIFQSISIIPNPSVAQNNTTSKEFIGSWMATQQFNKFQFRHFLHFEEDENGSLSGKSEIPALLLQSSLSNIKTNNDTLSFTVQGPGTPFEGVINESGTQIEGELGREPLKLQRLREPVEDALLDNPFPEPFHGITVDGKLRNHLFPIRSTGVSTAPIVEAAKNFLDVLTAEQREKTTFPIDASEWRHWTNSPFLKRQGVSLREMNKSQREAAFSLVESGLSARGFELSRDIMRIDDYVAEISGNERLFGEYLYNITIMGEPSMEEPWGWQLDGHHLVINYFVMGDQVVMTPAFFGSEPASVDEGEHAGIEVLQKEQDKGLAFMQSLSSDQQQLALIGKEKTQDKLKTTPFQDNLILEYAGINVDELNQSQRESLLNLIELYVGNIREGHAKVRMDQIQKHLDETYFAWIGEVQENAVYYYRIHSPVILIEFDHAIPQQYTAEEENIPTRNHIHTIMRTPNGNDYGKSLLQQHYEKHADNPNHQHHH